jgi:hypothetical protein
VDWAVASRAKPGEVRCGDLATVHVDEERCVMAVMDGLGHGPHAAVAAERMAAVVREHRTEPPDRLLMLAHKGLVDTRGVTATIAAIDATLHRMTWLGVGNVSGALVRADPDTRPRTHGVFLGRGVLGHQMPPLHRPEPLRLAKGDCIVFNTDGVHADVTAATHTHLSVERIAQTILDNGALPNDDALVLVARYYPTDEGALPR